MDVLRTVVVALLLACPAWGQFSFAKVTRHTEARLLLSHETARPGETIMAGVELTMAPEWHTYWRNPGDSGEETKLYWNLPGGISAGDILWPVPEKLLAEDLITYIYHGKAVLLVPLKIASDAKAGPREISVLAKWLECQTSCIPASNMVSATLTIGNESKPSADAATLVAAETKLPAKQAPGTVTARWDGEAAKGKRPLVIEWEAEAQTPEFYAYADPLVTISTKTELPAASAGKVLLRKIVETNETQWPAQVAGLLVRTENGKTAAYETTIPIGGTGVPAVSGVAATGGPATKIGTSVTEQRSLWIWLLYAFVGGLILNIMPCVLPVIALKILGFVAQSREHPRRVRALGLLYTLGVLASFLVLAGLVIGVQAAGRQAGWGMQFSSPQFIVVLTVVVTLVALNLFGVFEITLGGRAMTAASEAASRHGSAGAFMNGVLATVLATPCTAPFLGASLGFAFAQPPMIIVLFFLTIGMGLAIPYLILSFNPRWLKILPKPGAWMERFKIAMGFPLLATAVWLVSLTVPFYGDRFWWLCVFLVVVAFAAWIFGEFVQRGQSRRGLGAIFALLLIAGGFAFVVEGQLRWRTIDQDQKVADDTFQLEPGGVTWGHWSTAAIEKARAGNRPVLVDFTAKWCLTCNTIVKPAIENDRIREKLKEINGVALLADYTKYPPEITAELQKFGRAGVPLVVVYPKDSSKSPIVLPEVVTSSMISKALDDANAPQLNASNSSRQ